VPGVRSDVAFLESFASEMFAGRGTFGWSGGWAGDAYLVALYAHLQPEVVFDETIADRGLDDFRVLWLTDCDVLTETVARRIGEFQQAGGLVVGDERLCPAIEPDIRLAGYRRTGKADRDQAALLALAAQLRDQLDAHYNRYVNTSMPEVIPYRRRFGETDYVFLVNDRREYGQYVGQHGLVMEHGLPSQAVVSVRRPQGFVYDLVEHRQVLATGGDGQLQFDAALGPCDGRLFMISPQAIDRVSIDAPQRVDLAGDACCRIEVVDKAGARVDAVVPLEVDIRDPEGRAAEFSGYYAAESGALEIDLQIAPNDRVGVWQIDVRELASGRRATHAMRVGNEPPADRGEVEPADGIANPVQPRG
jgi:hypothetical protein